MHVLSPTLNGSFLPTRWTLVWRARGEGKKAFRALSELCACYHYPLYCFARRHGLAPEDAEDATQSFFKEIIEKDLFAQADESKGKLRTFLLTGFQWSLNHRRQFASRERRGGGELNYSLDCRHEKEGRYLQEPVAAGTPASLFDRALAMELLAASLAAVEKLWAGTGRAAAFTELTPFLSGAWNTSANFADAAAALGISVNAARQRACQLRRDYRKALLAEIGENIADHDPAALEEELHFLYRAVG